MFTKWHINQLRKARESRDIVEIARKAKVEADQARAERFQDQFEHVFGFRPQLGEPEQDTHRRSYWVQGFLFTIERSGASTLYVRNRTEAWSGLSDPRVFHHLLESGRIEQADG